MSKSTHNLAINAKDNTATAFQSIQARAIAAGNRISRVMGGAIAAAGAYLTVRSIKSGIEELGKLSDISMKTGMSVEFLTSATTAFSVAGLNIDIARLTKSMQYLEKTTGKTGENAFFETLQNIAAIEDPLKRGAEAMRLLGENALELQPLINGGEEVVKKFRTLQSLMPNVSSAAAASGDKIADAMTIAGKGAQSLWLKLLGFVSDQLTSKFPGDVLKGTLSLVNWVEYALKKAYYTVAYWFSNFSLIFQAVKNLLSGESILDVIKEYKSASAVIDKEYDESQRKNEKSRKEYLEYLKTISDKDIADMLGTRKGGAANTPAATAATAEAAAWRAVRIANELISGGSNSQRRLSLLGPDYQNEQRKQTEYLKKIADNTRKTAENVDDKLVYQETDLGV